MSAISELHPQFIERNGKRAFAVIPYDEFLAMQEAIEDYEDLRDLEAAITENADDPGIPLRDVMEQFAREDA